MVESHVKKKFKKIDKQNAEWVTHVDLEIK